MNNNNNSRDYITEKKTIYNDIERLKKIGIIPQQIIDDVKEVENDLDNAQKTGNFTASSYKDYTNRLAVLREKLESEWEPLYEMNQMASSLKISLDNIDLMDLKSSSKLLDELLNYVSSANIDHKDKEMMIGRIYKVIYDFVKLHALYGTDGPFLNRIKNNPTHTAYITELINQDINKYSTDSATKLMLTLYELEKQGMSESYLINHELILQIALLTKEDFIENRRKKMTDLYNQYKTTFQLLQEKQKATKQSKNKYEKTKKITDKRFRRLLGRILFWGISLGICTTGAVEITKKAEKDSRKYSTTTTVYDSETGNIEVTKDKEPKGTENHTVIVQEIFPWEHNPSFLYNDYSREIVNHEVEWDEQKKQQDYISNYVEIGQETDTDSMDELPEDFGYEEPKYKVIQKDYGEDYVSDGYVAHALFFGFLALVAIFVEAGIFYEALGFDKEGEIFDEFKSAKIDSDDNKEELLKNTSQLKALIAECKKLLNELQQDPNYCLITEQIDNKQVAQEKALLKTMK